MVTNWLSAEYMLYPKEEARKQNAKEDEDIGTLHNNGKDSTGTGKSKKGKSKKGKKGKKENYTPLTKEQKSKIPCQWGDKCNRNTIYFFCKRICNRLLHRRKNSHNLMSTIID